MPLIAPPPDPAGARAQPWARSCGRAGPVRQFPSYRRGALARPAAAASRPRGQDSGQVAHRHSRASDRHPRLIPRRDVAGQGSPRVLPSSWWAGNWWSRAPRPSAASASHAPRAQLASGAGQGSGGPSGSPVRYCAPDAAHSKDSLRVSEVGSWVASNPNSPSSAQA